MFAVLLHQLISFVRGSYSMVQFYPGFEDRLRAALRDLIGGDAEKKVVIGMAKDGSGVGGKEFAHPFGHFILVNVVFDRLQPPWERFKPRSKPQTGRRISAVIIK